MRDRSGFTLIEAFILMILVTVGVSASVYLIAVGTQMNEDNQETLTAYEAANSFMEFLRQQPYDTGTNLQIVTNSQFGTSGNTPGYDSLSKLNNPQGLYTIAYYQGDTTIKQVTITINWSRYKTSTRDMSVTLSTLITKNGLNS